MTDKYCNFYNYLEKKNKSFLALWEETCLTNYLRNESRPSTLLIPEKKDIKELEKKLKSSPEEVQEALLSHIVRGNFSSPSLFKTERTLSIPNGINVQKADSKEVVLGNGTKLKQEAFTHMAKPRKAPVLSVYKLEGPIDLTKMEQEKKGGQEDEKKDEEEEKKYDIKNDKALKNLRNHLSRDFQQKGNGRGRNVFLQKVCLQIDMLLKRGYKANELAEWLGTEEFSDSLLLDNFCIKKRENDIFSKIYDVLVKQDIMNSCDVEEYIEKKKSVLPNSTNTYLEERDKILNNVNNISDFRRLAVSNYNSKEKLGKDLFIVYTNLMKFELCTDSNTSTDTFNVDAFKDWFETAYYGMLGEDMSLFIKRPINPHYDLITFGTLMTTDLYKFHPSKEMFDFYGRSLPDDNQRPRNPRSKTTYSMVHIQMDLLRYYNKIGGGSEQYSYSYASK